MNRLFDLATVRPVLAAAVNLLLIAIGLGSAFLLSIREYPDIDPPRVSVTTVYTGAPAEVVEREVTKIVEDNLSGIEGVRFIRSISRNETSQIDLEFVAGTDIDAVAADVRDKVSGVRSDLPETVEEPIIEKASADDFPMMYVSLRSDAIGTPELTDVAERLLVDALGSVSGVSRITIGGEKRYAMRVWLDRRAMAARNITPNDVADRLRAENVELPAGQLETATQEITLRAETRLSTARDFAELTLRDEGGDRVRLGDVASVEVGVEDYKQGFRSNGEDAIALGVVRQSNANTLAVADGIRRELDRLRATIPSGIEIQYGYDESIFIKETLRNVATTLAQTVAIIIAVIYLFLGSLRATLVPAATIPASIIPAAAVAAAFGFSINVLSILAVILAISLCTDDAVVIMENIRRRQERYREPLLLATARATRQIGFATFASALTLVAVVLPLAFLQGNVGRLFREFAVVLAAIIAFSTVAALTLGPMLSARLFAEADRPDRLGRWVNAGVAWLAGRYRRALDAALRFPLVPILGGLAFAGAGALAFTDVRSELAPDEDRGSVSVVVEGPEGASSGYMREQVARIEAAMGDLAGEGPGRPLEYLLGIIVPSRQGSAPSNTARVIVKLKPWGEREAGQAEVRAEIQRRLGAVPGVRAFAVNPPKLGQRGGSRQLRFVVTGVEREDVVRWAEAVLEGAQGVPGLINLDVDHKDTQPQLGVTVDRPRAAALGVDARTVGNALQVMFGSLDVTRYVDRGEEYDVILQARPEDRAVPQDLNNVFVRANVNGALVPLSSVVRLEETATVRELQRLDRLAAVAVEANLAPGGGLTLGEALARLDAIAAERLPPEAQIKYLGESLDYKETGSAIYFALGLVLVLVYLLLAGQFESFLHPFVVLTSAPMALAGGVMTLWLFGLTLNVYSQIGLILLIGLVAKNAILVVEFANQLREEGTGAVEAAKEAAAQRLRPILMTSIATVLGAIPLVLESGAGAEARATVGAVTAGGVTLGTFLTLFVVPAFYVLLGRFGAAPGTAQRELDRLERELPEGAAPRAQPAE